MTTVVDDDTGEPLLTIEVTASNAPDVLLHAVADWIDAWGQPHQTQWGIRSSDRAWMCRDDEGPWRPEPPPRWLHGVDE